MSQAATSRLILASSSPDRKVLLDRGTLGDVKRAGAAFTAELRSVAHIVAFVKKLPTVSEADYKSWSASSEPAKQ